LTKLVDAATIDKSSECRLTWSWHRFWEAE
jgi:hypothetical protein